MLNENKKVNLNNLLKVMSYVLNYKFIFTVGIICMIISSLTMTISTVLIKTVIDNYIVPMSNNGVDLYNGFKLIVLKLSLVFIISIIARYAYSFILMIIESRLVEKMRNELFNKMMQLPISFFDERQKGDIMSLYTNDIDAMEFILSDCLASLICCSINIIGIISVMFYYNFKLTMLVFCIFCIMIFLTRSISIISKKLFGEQQKNIGAINGFIEEMVNGQTVVKVFCREKQTLEDFKKFNKELYSVSSKANTYSNALMPIMVNLGNIAYILVLILGSMLVMNNKMSLGVILALLRYTKAFVNPISELSEQFPIILKAAAGADRLFSILDMDIEVDDGDILINNGKIYRNNQVTNLKGNVKFNNVCFSYNNSDNVLSNINFDINCGQKIAFVGSTGAGKTTIINLIMRFYDINSGTITIDNININDIKKKDLRKLTSVVLQDVHMFNGSIIDNIKYGKLDVSDEEVMRVAKITKVDHFIKHLKDGYMTNLKSDAGNLSQGERQLLAITRAVVADRPILIFDEATSSVDTRTERLINDVLDTLFENKTVFVIAHRLSTVRNADKIIVLEKGEIIESGNHEELLKNKGKYYQLYNGMLELD